MRLPVYLDHHATTPVDPRVASSMLPYFTQVYGNPASQDHVYGAEAAEAVERARELVAHVIKARPEEIIFTSGATESDNTTILGVAGALQGTGNHIITSATEHKAILDPCRLLERRGFRVTVMPVDGYGLVDSERLRMAITPETILVSIMAANNEIGTLAPLKELAEVCAERGVYFHTDAAQAYGHVPVDVMSAEIDMMSISGHKIYGPKGVGALFVRRKGGIVKLAPLLLGGGQERGLRSGTLNVPGIVGLGEAARIAKREMQSQGERVRELSHVLLETLRANLGSIRLNGHPAKRLPHNLNITIPGVDSKALIQGLRDKVALSAGSACTTDSVEPSHVLLGIGLTREEAYNTVRIGIGRFTSRQEIEFVAESISRVAERIRRAMA